METNNHIWQQENPYYMQEGNYYANDRHDEFSSFDNFVAEWGDADTDYNRLHRYDFELFKKSRKPKTLKLYYVQQRKANLYSVFIKITEKDEQRIIDFLKPHAELTKQLWRYFF